MTCLTPRWSLLMPTRRSFVTGMISTLALPLLPSAAASRRRQMMLGFGTYGTRGLSTEDAIRLIAASGYDAIELTVTAGWDASPEMMPARRREEVRALLSESGLELTSLMESINPSADALQQQKNMDRLRGSAERGRIEIEYFGKEDLDRISRILLEGP